jgi:hypothetical protein
MIPEIPEDAWPVGGPIALRYEDVTQGGLLKLTAIPPALGILAWPVLIAQEGTDQARVEGIVPILYRLILEGGEGPVSVLRPVEGKGAVGNAVVLAADGSPERFVMQMWMELSGKAGWTHDPLRTEGAEVVMGRVYAEHAYTRLFSSDRKVRALPMPVNRELAWRDFKQIGRVEGEESRMSVVFGMLHTDANMHVNSLVYPRMIEEAVVAGWGDVEGVRSCELMFRKPFFAGERAVVLVSRSGSRAGGSFVSESGEERCRFELVLMGG